jgi:hypothetical protein
MIIKNKKMSEDKFNTQMENKLKEIKFPIVEVPETTLPGAKDLGAKAAETSMESGEEKNGFLIDEIAVKSYLEEFVEKTKAENKIKKFQTEIMKNIADSRKNGDGRSQDEIALDFFETAIKNTKTKDVKNKIEKLASHYRNKIEEENRKNEAALKEKQPTEAGLGEPKSVEKKPEDTTPATKDKSVQTQAEDKKTRQEKQKSDNAKENGAKMPLWKFGKRYQDFYRKDAFRDFDEKTKKPKGEWIHIKSYNSKDGTAQCYFGEVGSRKNFSRTEDISLDKLQTVLESYSFDKTGKKVSVKKPPEQNNEQKPEQTILSGWEEKLKSGNKKKEMMEKITAENQGLERFCKAYYEMCKKEMNLKYFREKDKESFLRILVGSHARETIETESEFLKNLKEEEKEKIIEEIERKITQK